MIRAKNYETVSKFVKVMPKIPWPLFSGHGVYIGNNPPYPPVSEILASQMVAKCQPGFPTSFELVRLVECSRWGVSRLSA